MSAKRIRNLLTVVLSLSMVVGSTVTAFADAGVSEGTGSYEGGEIEYPTLSITLPTIPEKTYDYIADPNGLIAATSAAHYGGATFNGTTGVFFKTNDAEGQTPAIYSDKSKAFTVTSQNARDVDITVKLEQKTAGSDIIEYSDSATFENTDKVNKLYLAVTDGAAQNPKTAALSSAAAATLTTTVEGIPANYEQKWTEDDGYIYSLKGEGLTDWKTCSYNLVGALNKFATWGDEVTFPAIKVTWSYKEHKDGPSVTPAAMSTSAKSATVSGIANEATLKSVKVVKADDSEIALTVTTQYTYTNNVFAIVTGKEVLLDSNKYKKYILTYSDDTVVEIPIVAAD